MIDLVFELVSDIYFVRIFGKNVLMGTSQNMLLPIDFVRINKETTIKEFPDLRDDHEWKEKAIERFKLHIKSFNTEEEIAKYVIDDLKKSGYTLIKIEKHHG